MTQRTKRSDDLGTLPDRRWRSVSTTPIRSHHPRETVMTKKHYLISGGVLVVVVLFVTAIMFSIDALHPSSSSSSSKPCQQLAQALVDETSAHAALFAAIDAGGDVYDKTSDAYSLSQTWKAQHDRAATLEVSSAPACQELIDAHKALSSAMFDRDQSAVASLTPAFERLANE